MKRLIALLSLCGFASGASAGEFDCVIQPRQVIELRSPVEGLLERIAVDRGDHIRKGQELAVIDTSVERVLAESAKHRSEMQGATRAGESKAQLSALKLARAQQLVRRAFISEQAQEEAMNEKQVADAELQEAHDNRRLAEIEYRRQLALIRLKTIRSPINGVVMERFLNPGELVEVGVGRKPILRLAETDTLYVEALLPAEVYGQVKTGMPGEVVLATSGASAERAAVTRIDRVLDAGSGTFGIRLELPNKDARLISGVRCRLTLASVNTGATAARAAPTPRTAEPARDQLRLRTSSLLRATGPEPRR